MGFPPGLFALMNNSALLASAMFERWAKGSANGFVKGALIGGVIAAILAVLKGASGKRQ
jgi:hypothetical protein